MQGRLLQTEALLCHRLTGVPHSGKPLHGRSWEQSLDNLHRNCSKPLVQVCGRHLGQNQNVEDFTEHINAADNNIMFTREDFRKPVIVTGEQAGCLQNPKPSGWDRANKVRGQGEGTEAHQGSISNLWLPKLDLCQNLLNTAPPEQTERRRRNKTKLSFAMSLSTSYPSSL